MSVCSPGAIAEDITVYAGGVIGVEALTAAETSVKFRAAGGSLYLHNDGWEGLTLEQQKRVLTLFHGLPVAIELGFREGAEAWAERLSNGYLALGIQPDFIAANAFDRDHRPDPEIWKRYTEALRNTGLPATTRILPTFEYANFCTNRKTLEENTVSNRRDFQVIIRIAGGLVLDAPPGYALRRERAYRDWILDAVHWSRDRGFTVVWICSPHTSGYDFRDDTRRFLSYLEGKDALPHVIVVENYTHDPPGNYPNIIGQEDQPDTVLGVAWYLAGTVIPQLGVRRKPEIRIPEPEY